MNSNLFLKVIIIILIFLIFLIVFFATLDDLFSWIIFKPDNAKIANGKVISKYYEYTPAATHRTRHRQTVLIVEYEVNAKKYTTKHIASYGIADNSQVGDTREVYYDEYQPKYGYVRPTISIYILLGFIIIMGIFISSLLIVIIGKLLFFYKIVKKYNYP